MNLRRRILFGSLGTITIMGVIAVLALLLLNAMHLSLLTVTEEYGELGEIDEARSHLEDARLALTERPARFENAINSLQKARDVLMSFVSIQHLHDGADEDHHVEEAETGKYLVDAIEQMIGTISRNAPPTNNEIHHLRQQIDEQRDAVLTLSDTANQLVDASLHETQSRTKLAYITLTSLCIFGVVFVWTLAFMQYRWVLHPVVNLRDRVRDAVAMRRPDQPNTQTFDPVGDLGRGFNGMFDELNELYDTLDMRVRQKSKELVMAERLASVGYLAAGVAHEINNPLNAILGYTELTIRDLSRTGEQNASATQSLSVVRDEAMRCKHIVEKLLSLVRNSDAPREAIDIQPVINDVAAIIQGLKQFRDHPVQTHIDNGPTPLLVTAREAELKQVLLNLVINAIEASPDKGGEVHVNVTHDQAQRAVCIEVVDQGHGMDAETRQQVFEPFFTRKRGHERSGTGLGLSVAHAIVLDHGGTITAHSVGPGKGSRFTVRLPDAQPQNPQGPNDE